MDNSSAVATSTTQPAKQKQPIVSAMFADQGHAEAAVRELREEGMPADSISLISQDADLGSALGRSTATGSADAEVQEPMQDRTDTAGSAAVGAGLGSVAGVLAGVAGLVVPGIGPFIAAGPVAAALGAVAAGGAAGGITGALSTIGLPQEYAREYAARLQQSQTLISVRTDDLTKDLIERVLVANGGDEVYCSS